MILLQGTCTPLVYAHVGRTKFRQATQKKRAPAKSVTSVRFFLNPQYLSGGYWHFAAKFAGDWVELGK